LLHILKLAVGATDVADLRRWQAGRIVANPPLRHQTRSMPRRRDEVVAGGSLYWVVCGFVQVRQRIVDVIEDTREGGEACCGLVLDPELVPVQARAGEGLPGLALPGAEGRPEDVDERPPPKAPTPCPSTSSAHCASPVDLNRASHGPRESS
jgi:hypothetical protein